MKLEILKNRVLWLSIVSLYLNLGSFTIVFAIIMKWVGQLPEFFLTNSAAVVMTSIVGSCGGIFITWASDPSRIGRRNAFILICSSNVATLLACWASGGGAAGAFTYLCAKTILVVIGGGSPQRAPYIVASAWLSDDLPEEHLTAGFSLIHGTHGVASFVNPLIVTFIRQKLHFTDLNMFLVAAVFAVLPIPLLYFLSPKPRPQVEPLWSPQDAISSNDSAGHVPDRRDSSRDVVRDVWAALRWMFTTHLSVTIIWIFMSFYEAGDEHNSRLFLSAGLKFNIDQMNTVFSSMGLYAIFITFFIVPGLSRFLSRGCIIFLGVACSVGHLVVYGFMTSPSIIIPLGFLGSMSFACTPTLLSYMKSADAGGASHGIALATFTGLSSFTEMVGPPLTSLCLQSYIDHRGLCYINGLPNFVGSGFVVLLVLLLPAIIASVWLLIQEIRSARRVSIGCEPGGSLEDVSCSMQIMG